MTEEPISKELLDILACPACKSDLKYNKTKLVCTKCKAEYQVKEGIPILLS